MMSLRFLNVKSTLESAKPSLGRLYEAEKSSLHWNRLGQTRAVTTVKLVWYANVIVVLIITKLSVQIV